MEFDERKIKPESTRKCLQQQVEEQSDVCDITVKMGQWERKYHRCVLMASPFFGCVLKNDFIEKYTERRFCYLQMEDRLRFLVRWYAAQPEKRKELTEKLLETIAFDDITMSCLNDIKSDQVVEPLLHGINVCFEDMHAQTDVLISISYDSLLCFDLARDTWFKLQSPTHEQIYTERIAVTKPDVPELYFTRCNYQGYQLHNVNLETDEIKTYEIVTNTSEAVKRTDKFYFGNNVCVVCKSEQVKTNRSDQAASSLNERMRLLSLLGPINEPALFQLLLHSSTPRYRDTTLVLIGKITGEKVEVVPQFSIADSEISSVTVNKDSVIALIPKSRTYVLVYDTVGWTMDKVELKTKQGDEIFSAENEFVIHNNERCITIKRISGPALSNRYEVKEYVLGEKRYSQKRYFFCNNTWFRYFRESYDSEYRFQCVGHSEVEEAPSPDRVVWKELSLPKESAACSSSTLGGTMHLIRLPRRLLRCHVDCPHCEAGKQRSTAVWTSRYADNHDYYYDDSDYDDYDVTYGMYDSDEYYNYSSD